MNPYSDTMQSPGSSGQLSCSSPESLNSHNPSSPAMLASPPVIHTGQSSVSVLTHNCPPNVSTSEQNEAQNLVQTPERTNLPIPACDPASNLPSSRTSVLPSVSNPYPGPATPPTCHVSVIIPSPDLRPSPLQSQCFDDLSPDLECSICFCQFNNVFRCPKMLHCKHTFCLECLARINVKAAQPNAIQCPLCRSFTPLPDLGLPKLATDSYVLSYLPAAMQKVYSIRFVRNKGKLQVKRLSERRQRWGQRSLTSLRNLSLDVGVPSPPAPVSRGSESGSVGRALFRLTGQPACRAFLLTSVVMMMALLLGIIIFLFTFNKDNQACSSPAPLTHWRRPSAVG